MTLNPIIRDGRTPNLALYSILIDALDRVPGALIEFGVYRGDTFKVMYPKALARGRDIHAVDSFRGMPKPTAPGDELYPEGAFDVGGSAEFRERFPEAVIHEGFVPEILLSLPEIVIGLAHVDLDHKSPTSEAIGWIWPRIIMGGFLVCHDFRFGQAVRAAGAISDWMHEAGIRHVGLSDLTIWFRKGSA